MNHNYKIITMNKKMIRAALTFLLLCHGANMMATDYFLAPTGSDTNSGKSQDAPFATLGAAIKAATTAGDNVYIAAGTYSVSESEIMGEASPYKLVYDFTHSGRQGRPISFIGLTDENGNRPVFDFSAVVCEGYRITAFHLKASWLYFYNFDVVALRNGIGGHSQSENFRLENATHCTLDNISAHDGMGIGFYITRHSQNNLVVNCDAFNNYDTVGGSSTAGDGGNNDGFGCHVTSSADKGNVFLGCRSWNNTDDGFDLINCSAPVAIAYCFAAYSGYDANNVSRGDGNGFKSGGFGMAAKQITVPDGGFPRHEIYNNVAYQNKANGFYANHHLAGVDFHNNTSVASAAYNYNLVNRRGPAASDNVDVNGYGHNVASNLSHSASTRRGPVGWLSTDSTNCTIAGNNFHFADGQWTDDEVTGFLSTDFSDMTAARLPSGYYDTPTLRFYQLDDKTCGSDLSAYETAVAEAKLSLGAQTEAPTAITTATVPQSRPARLTAYNTAGQPVAPSFRGLVIVDGKKQIRR